MASTYTLTSSRFPDGTTVFANPTNPPAAEPVHATVSGGSATFTGLRELEPYVAHATVNGRYVQDTFTTDGGAGSTEGGESVPAVGTEQDLPAEGDPPLMIFVRRDSTALDEEGNPLPALYLWSGTAWVRGGLAGGGGSADTDTYYVELDLEGALQDGQTVRWVDADDNFVPGVLVPE